MAVDYLKTYLGIDPNDYSSMEARIRGEEPQARTPVMMRQPMMMPQQRSLGDIEAMQLIPRQQPAPQPAPQVDDRYQGLMDQIAALRSQIEGMQAPTEPAPQVGCRSYQGLMADTPTAAKHRQMLEKCFIKLLSSKSAKDRHQCMAHDMASRPQNYTAPTPAPAVMSEPFQAPPEIENRAVGEPEPIPQAPAEDIQASINYLAGLPKMNIPQIPDIEEIKRKMAEANMNFPEPVSYPDQLQAIRDLPPMTSNAHKRRNTRSAMQNMPTPTAPASSMPKFNLPQMQSFGLPQQIAGGRTLMSDFSPRDVMRMAGGGGIDKAIYDLKFKLNGS
jgi:hypothetical protein